MTLEVNKANNIQPQPQALSANNSVRAEAESPSIFMNGKQEAVEVRNDEAALDVNTPEKTDQMTRKEAKAWIKEYREQHPGTSKKEAKAAFEAEFGYKMPSSKFVKILRKALLQGNFIGSIVSVAGGKERTENFIDYGYFKKDENV